MRRRQIGPFRAGRVTAVAGIPANAATHYMGRPGSVWKTVDDGTVWTPIFDQVPVSSVGAVSMAASIPNFVCAGTGDVTKVGGSVNMGNGVYKTTGAGDARTRLTVHRQTLTQPILVLRHCAPKATPCRSQKSGNKRSPRAVSLWTRICTQRFHRQLRHKSFHVRSRALISSLPLLALAYAGAAPPHPIRATGIIRAVNSVTVLVPRIEGQGGNLALATIAENGAIVAPGDSLATFDRANELKLLREAQTKFDDLARQIEEKKAEHLSNAEKRIADLQQAQADLKKAEIESRKGPVLSALDQAKNQVKLADARDHVASLQRSNQFHDAAEAGELRVLELQRDRQQVVVQRQNRNAERLLVKAPIKGMVALQNIFRNNSLGHAQEGDELWPGSPLLKLFDPSAMDVEVSVGEPDGAVLVPGAKAIVHLDAFPEIKFTAHYILASPVATAPLGMSNKSFTARFRLDQSDPHLLPDLSAAVDIEAPK
jgi:multidrug resistance efflux pump